MLQAPIALRPTPCRVIPNVSEVGKAIARLSPVAALAAGTAEPEPVFLLSNGWRTGSTLLQRILITDPSLILWGEPLGRMALIPRLTEAVCAMADGWPPGDYWIGQQFNEGATSWIANLFPPIEDFRNGLRQWLLGWLAAPAHARGFTRWGLKEVRLSAADALLLRWVFPKARFIILMRDPLDAYRSASRIDGGMRFWYRWPDRPVHSVKEFSRHWERLAVSWRELPADFEHILIRYEDMIAGKVNFRSLERALDLHLDEGVALAARVGATRNGTPIGRLERRRVLRATTRGREAHGY